MSGNITKSENPYHAEMISKAVKVQFPIHRKLTNVKLISTLGCLSISEELFL